jgi:hypothetical protein
MGRTLATLITISTYGTWLRGDARGWVDDGIIFPPDPVLESNDRARMKHDPYFFEPHQWFDIGQAIGQSLIERLSMRIYSMTIQSWHGHLLIGSTRHHIADVIKCAKDAARWHMRIDRPIWADDFDKRWCFDWSAVANRTNYVELHNVRNSWPRRPWPFIVTLPELR